MSKKNERGFTLIELLIVSIIVGILATLVATTYSGVQAKNRNANRQNNINTVQGQLETYYAQKSQYPSITQLNDANWRAKNLKDLRSDDIKDPKWNKDNKNCTDNNAATFSSEPTKDCYSYQATTASGSACTDVAVPCAQYALTAQLEGGDKYVKSSLN